MIHDFLQRGMGMHGWTKLIFVVLGTGLAAVCLPLSEFASHAAVQPKPRIKSHRCLLEPGPRHSVVSIQDSETVLLADGRKVRLLGTLGPRPPLSATQIDGSSKNPTPAWQPEQRAQEALKKLVEGRDVSLAFDQRRQDRYGRWLAHIFVWHNGRRFWVQGEMLAHGHARAYVVPGNTACISELIAHEKRARTARRGLWRHRHYRILKPKPAGWLLRKRRHRFEIVSGAVASVALIKSKIYLNFGGNWKQDFTAAISKRALLGSRHTVKDIVALKGQSVRVRGWIERRNGPYITLAHPDLIEQLAPNPPTSDKPHRDPPALAGAQPNDLILERRKPRLIVPRVKRGPPRINQEKKKRPTQAVPDALKL